MRSLTVALFVIAALSFVSARDNSTQTFNGSVTFNGTQSRPGNFTWPTKIEDDGENDYRRNETDFGGFSEGDKESRHGYGGFRLDFPLIAFDTSASASGSAAISSKVNLTLAVSTTAAANVSLFMIKSLSDDLDYGRDGLKKISDFGLAYAFTVYPPTVNVTAATLTVSSNRLGDLTNSTLSLFYVSVKNHFYGAVPSTNTNNSITYTLNADNTAVYFIAVVPSNVSFPCNFGEKQSIEKGREHKFKYDDGLFLNINNNATANLTVTSYSNSSRPSPRKSKSVGYFFDIDLTAQNNLTANITFSFNLTVLAQNGVDPHSLRWAVFDDVSLNWVIQTSGFYLDLNAQTFTQTVSHFSSWGVYSYDTTNNSTSSTNNGGSISTTTHSSAAYVVPTLAFAALVLALF
ncbi:hypothetical protein PROFUN_14909 [Planoprotostelium fungivorum]|uniref:Uncharacterized protein n=1 Tax=Planoprotostelium fungivorum TaxID=1890364 RepID=A0A2P6MY35_9EUKA|nr:hypothetical protein PROFUN_14909 [Planoprotostelium fungivorum]